MLFHSNTVLSFSDSRILNLYKLSKMSSDGICVIDNRVPSHFRIEFLNIIIISNDNCEWVGRILDRIVGVSDPEVLVDRVSDLSSTEEAVFFVGFFVPPD